MTLLECLMPSFDDRAAELSQMVWRSASMKIKRFYSILFIQVLITVLSNPIHESCSTVTTTRMFVVAGHWAVVSDGYKPIRT